MKKITYVLLILVSIVAISSCDYDDSNDIDLLNPIDSTQTGNAQTRNL